MYWFINQNNYIGSAFRCRVRGFWFSALVLGPSSGCRGSCGLGAIGALQVGGWGFLEGWCLGLGVSGLLRLVEFIGLRISG